MKRCRSINLKKGFRPVLQSRSAQMATMVLSPGIKSDSERSNEHPKSEQWVYVAEGKCKARIGKKTLKLKKGSVILINRGEPHQIENTGNKQLVTVNFYVPPAYSSKGELKPSAK